MSPFWDETRKCADTSRTFCSDIRAYADLGGEYHSDHSHEANPPAYTMLRMIKTPETGGDTIFTSQTALYDKLSPTFQKLFDGLHGVHSSEVRLKGEITITPTTG